MRKKIIAKVSAPNKVRAATYLDDDMWNQIKEIAKKSLTSESHIMRVLLSEALHMRMQSK